MNFDDWLRDGSIKRFRPAETQLENLLSSAGKDLQAATELVSLGHHGIARDTAYEAMLKSGMALMYSRGYRPEAGSHHVTIVRFTARVLGSRHADLIDAFDRFRRTRHQRLYQGREAATKSQAEKAIDSAQRLLSIVRGMTV